MQLTRRALWQLLAAAPPLIADAHTTTDHEPPKIAPKTLEESPPKLLQQWSEWVLAEVSRSSQAPSAYCPLWRFAGARTGSVLDVCCWWSTDAPIPLVSVRQHVLGETKPIVWGQVTPFRFFPHCSGRHVTTPFTRSCATLMLLPVGCVHYPLPEDVFRAVYLAPIVSHLVEQLGTKPLISADLPHPLIGAESALSSNSRFSIRAACQYAIDRDVYILRFDILVGPLDADEPVRPGGMMAETVSPDHERLWRYYAQQQREAGLGA